MSDSTETIGTQEPTIKVPQITVNISGHEMAVMVKELLGDAVKAPGKRVKGLFKRIGSTVKGAVKGAKDGFNE